MNYVKGNKQPEDEEDGGKERPNDTHPILYLDGSGTTYENVPPATAPHINEHTPQTKRDPRPKANWAEICSVWISAAALVATVIALTGVYYTWRETRKSADAAICASRISSEALTLSRQEFESSQAAVLQPVASIRGQFVQVDVMNVGHRPATNIRSVIQLSYGHSHESVHLPQIITERTTSSQYPTGFVSRTLPLRGSITEQSNARVDVPIHYWNGIEEVDVSFSLCPIFSPYGSAPDWQDCENQKAYQQKLR